MNEENVMRDDSGKIISYDKKKSGCAYGEVLATMVKERMERIESNIGDARIEIRMISNDVKETSKEINGIKIQTTQVCGTTHELINEVRGYVQNQNKINDDVKRKSEEREKRLQVVEKHINYVSKLWSLFFKILAIATPTIGLVLGVITFFKKHMGG